ncbi:hypothetical protein DRN52_06590 [Thermococci archaeon]|nr:MAG: hypothetical protein DRN52_06590 [Thermococci archaeon]
MRQEGGSEIVELREMLEDILERLGKIEKLLSHFFQFDDGLAIAYALVMGGIATPVRVLESIETLRELTARAKEIGIADDISRVILSIIAVRGSVSISELTRYVREVRGSASRRIVSERVMKLKELGILDVETRGKKKMVRKKGEGLR